MPGPRSGIRARKFSGHVPEYEIERAAEFVHENFPFPDYFDPDLNGHYSIARTVSTQLPISSKVLDFGAGPADRTAVLARMGYQCTAMDDLGDEWHSRGTAREEILAFAKQVGIDYVVLDSHSVPPTGEFDMVMLHDVLEHLHDSPRDLLSELVSRLGPDGLLYVTVPNHVNLRKRLAVLRGRTSHPQFEMYYWYPGSWRGHVREYTHGDLVALAEALGLEVVEIRGVHHMLQKVPPRLRPMYGVFSNVFPGIRDSWSMVARKPAGWSPRTSLTDGELRAVTGLTSWGEVGH